MALGTEVSLWLDRRQVWWTGDLQDIASKHLVKTPFTLVGLVVKHILCLFQSCDVEHCRHVGDILLQHVTYT